MLALERGPTFKMMTLSDVMIMAILSTFVGQVASEILYGETAPMTFEVWAADLKPGFVLREKTIGDRSCVCKKPEGSYTSYPSSFVFHTPGPLTSSGLPGSSFDYIFITPGGGGNPTNTNTTTPGSRTSGTTTTTPTSTTTSTTPAPTTTTTTSTSTTTTTPVPTTTTSTSTSTTSTSTTTTSSTSTSASTTTQRPTTTTSSTTTTTAAGGACGQCNMDILIDDSYGGQAYEWTSPGWNDGQSYPDGCTCVLTVRYRSTQHGAVKWTFDSGSTIKSINNCAFDRMEVILNGAIDTWCDTTLPSKSGSDPVMAVNADYKFTFISDFGDGNQVEKGFKLTIEAFLFGG